MRFHATYMGNVDDTFVFDIYDPVWEVWHEKRLRYDSVVWMEKNNEIFSAVKLTIVDNWDSVIVEQTK